ncbi:MFS transporter [Ferrovibrio sp.]|uniref:MFS transporter n=1 Tax=Ferrovibrio sp. TaxID=1917215 RepID=UPI001B64F527|nr:MFS transporter [Ferrovibrio sp.]MBP7065317.1 MFS transporter [Ferrovibrio sp.]
MNAPQSEAGALPTWPVLAATTGTQSFTTLCALGLSAVAPRAAASLDVGPALVGYQVAIVYTGAMLTSLIGGNIVRRFGPTRASQIALWVSALGCACSAFGTLWSLALGALIMGSGYGFTNPAASLLLSRVPAGGRMNLIFSIKQCGVPIGGMLAGLLLPPVTLAFDWRAAMLLCALLASGLSLMLQPVRRAWDGQRQTDAPIFARPFDGLRLIWNHPILRWLALASLAYSAVQLSVTGFLVTYLVAEVNFTLLAAGSMLAIVQIAGACGRLAWGMLADRLRSGLLVLIINGAVAVLAALATAAIAPDWPWLAIAAAAGSFGFCAIGWNGVFIAVIARQVPVAQVGHATGGTLSITYAGVLLGPSVFAALHDKAGMSYGTAYALMAVATLIGIGLLIQGRRNIRR